MFGKSKSVVRQSYVAIFEKYFEEEIKTGENTTF